MTESIREPRLYLCDLCGFEDEYNNIEETMSCPFCQEGTLRLVTKSL